MERGGYIKRLGRGMYHYSPLLQRVLKKTRALIEEEMARVGAQEVVMPLMQPAQIWKESGRLEDYLSQGLIYLFEDHEGQEVCLSPTHEEAALHFVKNQVTSYKQLPITIYQVGTKFRDEIRPRFGLMRAKEFMMKDAYSFSINRESFQRCYEEMHRAYRRILDRLELHYAVVQADGGSIGKGRSEEFQILCDAGEDELLVTSQGASNVEVLKAVPPPLNPPALTPPILTPASFPSQESASSSLAPSNSATGKEEKGIKESSPHNLRSYAFLTKEEKQQLQEQIRSSSSFLPEEKSYGALAVQTANETDLKALQEHLQHSFPGLLFPQEKMVKTLIYKASYSDREEFVAAIIRGDRQVNEVKMKNLMGSLAIELATKEEVARICEAPPGFVGPNVPLPTYFDQTVASMEDFIVASGREGVHLLFANWGEQGIMPLGQVVDLLRAKGGDLCAETGEVLTTKRGVEVGHIFELGELYSKTMDLEVLDQEGQKRPLYMGCYGMGITRLIAAAIEQKSTPSGIVLPKLIAPFQVVVTAVSTKDPAQTQGALELYQRLLEWGCDAALDDRDQRLGFKMKDAALIGIPIRLIIGKQWVQSNLIEVEGLEQVETISKEQLFTLLEEEGAI